MTSAEKRRSGRKNGGHRKHSDGGYSDTSSGGSFLDETDREVSNLTDRAFRSLCIGDEAVYNDSDVCSSSPYTLRDRQLAFSQSGQSRDREDTEEEELKRAAHESFSLRVQQYEQDWIHGGMYGAHIYRDPGWEVYGEKMQGEISATFQHSFVETSQQEQSLREDPLFCLSNGATELSPQYRRSRSRVSSLIRAFNSEGHRDGAVMDGKLREGNDETNWDKAALISIQKELSEFSTSYQKNFHSGHFPSASLFSSRDTNVYSSEVAAAAHMNPASSFMRSSHSKHSMYAQVNSNVFMHSEFSPFKVWRDHNRFPFQQGQVSGFMHCSEFPKWYETPMYREISLDTQPQGLYRFEERGIRHSRNKLAPMLPPTPPRSTSTSTMLQKASGVEKRCDSELAGHSPHRKQIQSLGTNRLLSQHLSTASATTEMSHCVQDTTRSTEALRQNITMMTGQNMAKGMIANQQGVLWSNNNVIPFVNTGVTLTPNVVSSTTSTTASNISQLLIPSASAHHEAEPTEVWQYTVSPPPVEHPPVQAESRGATPDVRMSSYKARTTNLLFNLKDNRKRVKSTYSPTKFKGFETLEKNKQPSIQEPRDTVIDIPDFPDPDIQFAHVEDSSRTITASHQYVKQHHSPGVLLPTQNSQPSTAHTSQNSEYSLSDYQTAQMQGEMVQHSGLIGLVPENYTSSQLANGQNLHEELSSFTPYKQVMIDNVETLGEDVNRLKLSYTVTETPMLNVEKNQTREYLISKANTEQNFNETLEREFTRVDRHQQQDNKYNYSNVSSQDKWGQTNSQDTKKLSVKTAFSPWKQDIRALIEKDQHAKEPHRVAAIKEELNIPRDKYKGENEQNINKEPEKRELRENFGVEMSSHKKAGLANPAISNQLPQYAPFSNDIVENQGYYEQPQPGAFRDKCILQKYYKHKEENEMDENYLTQSYKKHTDQEYRKQHNLYSNTDKTIHQKETGPRGQYTPISKVHEVHSVHSTEPKLQSENNGEKNVLSNPDNTAASTMANQVKDRQLNEVKAEQATVEYVKAEHAQAELARAQPCAQTEQPKAESRLILERQTVSEKAEQANAELKVHERAKQAIAEHVKEEERKGVQTEQSREKQPEQVKMQKATEDSKNITEEAGALHMKEKQGDQVRAEQAEAEWLKEHIKTELTKPEQPGQARIQQAEQTGRESVKAEQGEGEQIRTQKVKAELAEAGCQKSELIKLQQINEQQEKMKVAEVGMVTGDHIKAEDGRKEKVDEDSSQVGQVNSEQPITQRSKTKNAKVEETTVEQAKLEQTKVELVKAELTKTEIIRERLSKPTANLTMTQHVKSEPDKVEQVKTELARAKAELAKIKEKMRGEQKEKVRNVIIIEEDSITKNNAPVGVNINKNEVYKKKDKMSMHQKEEDSELSRNGRDQADKVADDSDCLREKHGFTNAISSNRNKESTAENKSSDNDSQSSALSLHNAETMNNEKSKDECCPTSDFETANTENKEEVSNFKVSEVTEGHYVYSESSKEFKLTSAKYLPINLNNRENNGTFTDKVKDESVEKLEKYNLVKQTDVSQQRDSDLAKPLLLETKLKSAEHSVGPVKDPHHILPKALSHKERAQTKQEILTSKIKAHAEKEISAIKEKGFALRDGFISKNSTKHLAGSQSINIRHRPPSQEVCKKHESTTSSTLTPKQQMEPLAIRLEPVKSVSPPSSAIIPVKSATTTSQVVDDSQNQVPTKPVKSNDNMQKQCKEARQTGSYQMGTDEGLAGNQKKEKQLDINLPMQSTEQALENNQEANLGKNYGKQEEHNDNPSVKMDHLCKKNEDPPQAAALAEAESARPMTPEKDESKHEAVPEDSLSLRVIFSENKNPVPDDSLQIVGLMVSVLDKRPSLTTGQGDDCTLEQMNAKEKECSDSELDTCHIMSGLEVRKGKTLSSEVSIENVKDGASQENHPTVKEDQTEVGMNIHPGNMNETSTLETRKNNVFENVTEKLTNLQQESSSINARPQRETQLQEPLAGKGVLSAVTVPAKNKVLNETQALLYNQDVIARENRDFTNKTLKENSPKSTRKDEVKVYTEEKNLQKSKTAHTTEHFMSQVVNTTINYKNDFNTANAESLIKHDVQPSAEEALTMVMKTSKSRNIDGEIAPLLEEKRHESIPPRPFNKTRTSDHLTENENRHISSQLQYEETNTGENNKAGDNVHMHSTAIRVVPAVTEKDSLQIVGKHDIATVTSDVVATNKNKQVASSSYDEKVNALNGEDITKDLTPASSEMQMKDSLEDKLGVHYSVRKLSNSIGGTHDNTQADNAKPEKPKKSGKSLEESKIQTMEGDYFQVQGVKETNDEAHNSADVGDMSDGVSKARGFPGFLPNKALISKEPYKGGKNEEFELDQSQTVDSSSISVQNENMKKKNSQTEDKQASKQSDAPIEKQSNNEKMEAGQAHYIRKHHMGSQSSLSARERQRSRNVHLTAENAVKEKPELRAKPKERASTIPEISALADYARLKVIVSEEQENTTQEFGPNKKEGFFPLIQTRHSRRPMSTADPKDLFVKEKSLPNKTETSAKVNKEPKALVFPITEKEHQRTGMYKLGDKEKHDKMLLEAKFNKKYAHDLNEKNKPPTGQTELMSGAGTHRVSQAHRRIHHPDNHLHTTPAVDKPRNTSEELIYLDKNSHIQPTLGQKPNIEESMATLRKVERIQKQKDNNTGSKTVNRRTDKPKQEVSTTHQEETKAKQTKDERAAQKEEEMRTKQREEKRKIKETEEKRRMKIDEVRRAKLIKEEEQQRRAAQKGLQKIATLEEQQRRAAPEEQQRRAALEEQQRRAAPEEQQRRAAPEEEQRRAALEEQQRRAALEEQQRRAAQKGLQTRATLEELQRRVALEEQQRRAAPEEQQRRAAPEEEQRRAALEEQQRRAAPEEEQRRAALEEQQRRAALEEQQRRAAPEEQQRRAAPEEEQRKAALEEQQRRAAPEEEQRRAALEEQQRRAAPEEQQRRAAPKEEQRRAALEEQQRRAALEEQQRRAAPEEQQRRAAPEEEQRKAALEEQQRRAVPEEEQRRAALEEQQRRAALEEQRRAALEEQQRRAALEEQQRRATQKEQQRRAALEEQQRRAALEEEQRRAAQKEQQRRAALEEQQRRAALEEEQRRAALEQEQRRAALEQEQRRAAQEEQERRAAQEEQQRRAALKEQQMRTALEEEQRRAALEVQQRRAAQKEQQRRAALKEQQMRTALEEEQRRAAPEEEQRRAAPEEQQRRAAQKEQQRRAAQEEEQRRAAQEEQQRRAAQEEQQRRAALIEEQKLADQVEEKTLTDFEKEKKRKQREEEAAEISGEEMIKQIQEEKKAEQQTEQQRRERQKIQEWMRTLREEEEERKAIEIEKTIIKQKEENQAKGEKTRFPEVSYTAVKEEEKRVAGKQMLTQREDEISAKEREEGKSAAHRDKERAPQRDEQKKVAQRMAALQYYAITSTESESKPEERQLCSPLLPQQRHNPSELESVEDTGPHPRPYRPHAPASPVPSLPRSNTASPALGPKPSMFRVKDNTTRGYSFTKSVKPRFHKNLGEDFHAGLTMDRQLERGDEEQEIMRPSTVTSAHPDIEINRLDTVKESLTFQPVSSSQGYPAPLPQHRPYFRRSIALDDDDSRSVISTMSEDVESFASSAAHLSDVRCMYDYKRPESACSFSSDMSRSLGKPPTVPPKSDKALRRAKRLSSRRINRELSKAVADNTAGVKKSPQEVSNIPSTSSTEVRSFTRHAVASPHISALVSLAHAPALGSSLPSHTEHQSSNHSIHAPSYATCPISLPASLPHANAPASHIAAPKTVAHVASSPTLQHANHPAPVTQYHVESSYPQPYPLTQRKVLQDPGSGQYFVVDMPVQVKKKTFFDPETGNYVQLNVRESSQSTSCPQLQQTYSQPQLQPQIQAMLHQHPLSRASPAGKPFVLYQGYDGCPQGHQPINSVAPHRSSGPVALHQDQQPVRENHSYGYSAPQMGQNSEGSCYSPEKTPYMDTVNETDKTYSTVYNTHGSYESFPECDTNSQLAGSSVCENDNSAHSRYQPRDIIAMSELEDFMEVSDC